MAKSGAERQREYRKRHASNGTSARINMVLSAAAVTRLSTLAKEHGVTKKVMLERLILGCHAEVPMETAVATTAAVEQVDSLTQPEAVKELQLQESQPVEESQLSTRAQPIEESQPVEEVKPVEQPAPPARRKAHAEKKNTEKQEQPAPQLSLW